MLTVEQKLERQIDELIKQNAALAAENETLSEKLAEVESQQAPSHSQQIPPSLAGFVLYLRDRYRLNVSAQVDEYLNLSDRCPNHENTNQDTPKA